ncbi:MAG: glycosyltransferase [Chitinophagaceae bacterium]|nr:glycosyltransferase [Chitinophagaceae bacterium]
MKVLHIITGLNQGGAESALFRLVTQSKNPEVQFSIISLMDEGHYGPLFDKHEIEVTYVNLKRNKSFFGVLKKSIFLYKTILRIHPDVIQTWMYHADLYGGIIGRIVGVKRIFWSVHHFNLYPSANKLITLVIIKCLAKLAYLIPTKVVFCSSHSAVKHVNFGYPKSKVVHIPLGYDQNDIQFDSEGRTALRSELHLHETSIIIGFLARWDIQKDHENLIKAFSILHSNYPNAVLILAGPGIGYDNAELNLILERYCVPLEKIRLLGPIQNTSAFFSMLDLHVLPSRGEAFPNVVAESMLCGIPNVATNVGDVTEILGDTGWIVPSQNAVALAGAISDALGKRENFDIWKDIKEKSRQRIVNLFSIEKMIDSYYAVWQTNDDEKAI